MSIDHANRRLLLPLRCGDIVDRSPSAHAVTVLGDAAISCAQEIGGTGSCAFNGTTSRLQIADHADFNLSGVSEWALDAVVVLRSHKATWCLLGKGVYGSNLPWAFWITGSDSTLGFTTNNDYVQKTQALGFTLPLDTPIRLGWRYYAGAIHFFVDGDEIGSGQAVTVTNAAADVMVGALYWSAPSLYLDGYLVDLQLIAQTVTSADFSADYTPAAYPGIAPCQPCSVSGIVIPGLATLPARVVSLAWPSGVSLDAVDTDADGRFTIGVDGNAAVTFVAVSGDEHGATSVLDPIDGDVTIDMRRVCDAVPNPEYQPPEIIQPAPDYLSRLLGHLHRVFDKDAKALLALRVGYDGSALTWEVADETLTTAVTGGTGADLEIPLAGHTVATLADAIEAEAGYSVPYQSTDIGGRSALILLDGSGNQGASNGDWLMGYTSLLWAVLHPVARALKRAYLDISEAVHQIYLRLVEGDYADEHGGYYGVPRAPAEADADYRRRIVAAVLMARNNNVAIQLALAEQFGVDPDLIRIIDADDTEYGGVLVYDGSWAFGGSKWFNGRTIPGDIGVYRCQFSVVADESIVGAIDLAAMLDTIDAFKAAGTRLLHVYRGHPLVYDGSWDFDGTEQFNARIIT